MPLLISLFFGFTPALLFAYVLYWLDRYEKEPKILLGGVFLWGMVVAAGGSFIINSVLGIGVYIFTNSAIATELATGSIIAPLVEESLKGLAVLGVFLIFRREFDSILDGIIYAGIAALGFTAAENTYYIYNLGFQEAGWEGLWYLVFIRVILVGWQHPFYSAFTGIGLAFSRLSRNTAVKIIAPFIGLGLAMFTHAFHNTLGTFISGVEGLTVGTLIDWTGWLFMLGVILWATHGERQNLRRYLWEEVTDGIISQAHYQTASSAWAQGSARLAAIFSGHYTATARFYHLCGELAHKKRQLFNLAEDSGNREEISRMRAELAQLAPRVRV